jgi:hypothetical protein
MQLTEAATPETQGSLKAKPVKSLRENWNWLSPEGTAELSPGRSPGVGAHKRVVPQGRLKRSPAIPAVPTGLFVLSHPTQDYVLG